MRRVFYCLCVITFPIISSAQDKCSNQIKDIPIKSIIASAGAYANLRNNPGSVSYESTAIFNLAKDTLRSVKAPDQFCPSKCVIVGPSVLFRSAPEKVLSDSNDKEYCKDLEKQTSKSPLSYSNSGLHSIEDLNKWIGDLSQGKGMNGGDLYKKCDRSCSPRYEYLITRNKGDTGHTVNASVICGSPRDKSNNNYMLDAFFRWSCESKPAK